MKNLLDTKLFDISINKDIYTSFERGEDGTIVYFTIKNKSEDFLYLNFTSFTIVVNNNQKEYDSWFEDYNISNAKLLPLCNMKGAVIFHGVKINKNSNVLLLIEFNCDTDENKYLVTFSKNDNKWSLTGTYELEESVINKSNEDIKLKVKELEEKLLNNTEKIDSFEEKYGVSIENLYIQISNDFHKITFTGELIRITNQNQYKDFWINITFYNSDGKIITSRKEYFRNFEDYDTFEVEEYNEDLIKKVDKIRIYVKGK